MSPPFPLLPCQPTSLRLSRAQEEIPSDEYSDFREHKSKSDSLHSPTSRFHPRPLVVRKAQWSSPTQSGPAAPKSSRYSVRQKKGLGRANILNTTEEPLLFPKVRN
jgi:hypothetical protein